MQKRMIDRRIEAAEARSVCERAIGEQSQVRPLGPMPQPAAALTDDEIANDVQARRCASAPGFRPNGAVCGLGEALPRLPALRVG